MFSSKESENKIFNHAFQILNRFGIILDENTLFGKHTLAKYSDEIIQKFYSMGYEGELELFGYYFNYPGEIIAIYDTEYFKNLDEVKHYMTDYIKEEYKNE